MKDELRPPTKHQLDHVVPTVIHHPEEDLPVLAKWVNHAMANPGRFWGTLTLALVALIAVTVVWNLASGGRAGSDAAWSKVEEAKTPAERIEAAKDYPNTPAARWALLQAAGEFYDKGFADLPANRDVAAPDLKKALDLFEQVASESPQDSPQALTASFGAARTLEARNELVKAIDRYDEIAKKWPDSDEGKQSKQLADALRKPENVAFYKDLYAFKASEVTIPPGGQTDLTFPPGHPPLGGSMLDLLPPPPPPTSAPRNTPIIPVPAPELPDDVFAPKAEAETKPKAESKPAEAKPAAASPAPETTGAPTTPASPTLPQDVFAPKDSAAKP